MDVHSADGEAARAAVERDEARGRLAAAEARIMELQAMLDAKVSPEVSLLGHRFRGTSDALQRQTVFPVETGVPWTIAACSAGAEAGIINHRAAAGLAPALGPCLAGTPMMIANCATPGVFKVSQQEP